MCKRNDIPRTRNHVVDALNACVGALRAMELAAGEIPKNDRKRRQRLVHAIHSLRAMISELRALERPDAGRVADGFVLPRKPGPA